MTQQQPVRMWDGVPGQLPQTIVEGVFENPGLGIILGIVLAPFAVFIWAWKQDFPDKPNDPKRVEGECVEAIHPSEASSYIWDREIDGT